MTSCEDVRGIMNRLRMIEESVERMEDGESGWHSVDALNEQVHRIDTIRERISLEVRRNRVRTNYRRVCLLCVIGLPVVQAASLTSVASYIANADLPLAGLAGLVGLGGIAIALPLVMIAGVLEDIDGEQRREWKRADAFAYGLRMRAERVQPTIVRVEA
ncbi:MAG: hypothetical protein OXF02_04555 [Simkaniaceae bacterium]|nr:hypothetical protein [Simkaniaceae bacterium]